MSHLKICDVCSKPNPELVAKAYGATKIKTMLGLQDDDYHSYDICSNCWLEFSLNVRRKQSARNNPRRPYRTKLMKGIEHAESSW